jgi:hypothetical protein
MFTPLFKSSCWKYCSASWTKSCRRGEREREREGIYLQAVDYQYKYEQKGR